MSGHSKNISAHATAASSSSSSSGSTPFQEFFVTQKDASVFTVTGFTVDGNNAKVFIDGILLSKEMYKVVGNVITLQNLLLQVGANVIITN